MKAHGNKLEMIRNTTAYSRQDPGAVGQCRAAEKAAKEAAREAAEEAAKEVFEEAERQSKKQPDI